MVAERHRAAFVLLVVALGPIFACSNRFAGLGGPAMNEEPEEEIDASLPDTQIGEVAPLDVAPPGSAEPADVSIPVVDGGCPPGRIACDDFCIDPNLDPENCGSCGRRCTEETKFSRCIAQTCTCADSICSDSCVVKTEDPSHCGACGARCAASEYCAGTCRCRPGLVLCNGRCVDRAGDADYCGVCGRKCKGNESCVDGECRSQGCPTGRTRCGPGPASCFDLTRDSTHCGACDVVCATDQICVAGQCRNHAPAVGCTSCPCPSCNERYGDDARCCSPLPGHGRPICVEGSACP
jgi:hypothetical protein